LEYHNNTGQAGVLLEKSKEQAAVSSIETGSSFQKWGYNKNIALDSLSSSVQ
jgi:hypothetical protein